MAKAQPLWDRDKHTQVYARYYEAGLLDADIHHHMVRDLEGIALRARVAPVWIHQRPLTDYCDDEEIATLRAFRSWTSHGISGMVYTGRMGNVEDKFSAMTGFFIRNFIDARVLVLQDLLDRLKDGDTVDATVLLIPNFALTTGGQLPDWKVSGLMGWLLDRHTRGRKTIVYAHTLSHVRSVYGEFLAGHVEGHYQHLAFS